MKVRIGTRGSALAMVQTRLIQKHILAADPSATVEIIEIKTLGDRKQGTAAAGKGDKKDWILDLELALLSNDIDLAVHSGKDVPSDTESGTSLLPVLQRAPAFDIFIGKMGATGSRQRWETLPKGSVIGTASLRRKASLLRMRPDLKVIDHRGNVPTRLQKLDEHPEMQGIVLANAGVERLGIPDLKYEPFPVLDMMPAINQGTLIVQFKSGRSDIEALIKKLIDPPTYATWAAERGCVSVLGADCKSSVSIYAETHGSDVVLSARILSIDGREVVEGIGERAPIAKAYELGVALGKRLLANGGARIIEEARKSVPNS